MSLLKKWGKALDDLYFYGYNYKSESRPNRFGCCLACKPGFFNSTLGGKVDSEFPFDCLSGLQSGGIDVFANRD